MGIQIGFNSDWNVNLHLGDDSLFQAVRDLVIERSMKGLPTRFSSDNADVGAEVDLIIPANSVVRIVRNVESDTDNQISEEKHKETLNKMRKMADEEGLIVMPGLIDMMMANEPSSS